MHTTPHTTHTSTEIFTSIKLYVILLLSLLLVSCGGGGGGGPVKELIGSTESTVSINVTTNVPVAEASCALTDLADKKTIQSNKTDSTGHSKNTATITVGVLTIACSDGNYTYEATGSVIDAPTMHAVGYHSSNEFSATVSPLSEIAYQRTIALAGMGNVASRTATEIGNEHKAIATLFGLEGIDILKTIPTPLVGVNTPTAVNNNAPNKFAILLAGLSQLFAGDDSTSTSTEQVAQGIRALGTDLADGTFDDKEKLIKAIEDFDDANKDSLGYNDTIVPELIAAIRGATTTLTAVAAPVLSIATGVDTSPIHTVGDTITPMVFSSIATNGGATECSINALPPGLQLNGTPLLSTPATSSGTCELTGTLTTASSPTKYTIAVGNIRDISQTPIEITVNKIKQTPLTNPTPTTATFGDGQLEVSAEGGTGTGTVSATNSSNTNVAEVSEDGKVVITGVGITTITLTKDSGNNYEIATTTYTLTVAKAEQSKLFNTGATTTTFGVGQLTVRATGGSGNGAVSATNSSNADVATVSGTQITITGAGTTIITLTKDGGNNYEVATTAYTLTVNKAGQSSLTNPRPTTATSGVAPLTVSAEGGSTNGAVSATNSSNTNVAEVSEDGKVVIKGAGTTTITVIKAGNDDYLPIDTTYMLTVFPPNVATITAQVGVNDSTMQITNPTSDTYTVYVSNDTNCNTTNYSVCTNGQMQSTPAYDSTEFSATALTLGGSPTFGVSENTADNTTTTFAISLDKFSDRYQHQVVEMNGDLYLIGGRAPSGGATHHILNDVWKSTDNGQNWVEILSHNENPENNQFSPRGEHQVVVNGDVMYLIGGQSSSDGFKNDVWKSSNGKDWEQIFPRTNTPDDKQFSPRMSHQVVVKDGAMYLIGGHEPLTGSVDNIRTITTNDVWKSTNGEDWQLLTPTTTIFSPREGHQVVVKDDANGGAMYLIGGRSDDEDKNDVWKSEDGVSWKKVFPHDNTPDDKQFSPRSDHEVVVIGDDMYLIGGVNHIRNGFGFRNIRKNDVWKSSDGESWQQVTPTGTIFSARQYHQVVVNGDAMYLIGGYDNLGLFKNDVWKSTNGEDWQLVTNGATNFIPRDHHQVVEMKGDLYLIGGDDDKNKNDVWKSTDTGKSWTQVLAHTDTPDNTQFTPREGHQVVVKDDAMYLIGGYDSLLLYKNDVWKSTNGESWQQITPTGTIFSPRSGHQVVVIGEDMYLIGGFDNSLSRKNDVWKSSNNGESWASVTENADFTARSGHQVVVKGEDMYLIGGFDNLSLYKKDVWQSSNNGESWASVTENADFTPRENHQVVVIGDDMYLIGGVDASNRFNDVWRSTDGKSWTPVSIHDANSNTKFAPRESHRVVVVADGDDNTNSMLVIGGSDDSTKFNDVWSSTDGSNWFLHVRVTVPLN